MLDVVARRVFDLAYDAEDRIDTFNHVGERRRYILRKVNGIWKQRNVKNRIKKLIDEVKKIQQTPCCPDSGHWRHSMEARIEDPAFMKVPDIVGLESHENYLAMLMNSEQLQLVSIAGKRGLGKTTLTKNFYTRRDVIEHFDVCVWICACPEYTAKDLLLHILKQVMEFDTKQELSRFSVDDHLLRTHKVQVRGEIIDSMKLALENMGVSDLKGELRKQLDGRKYLVVIDDMMNRSHWYDIHDSFPDQNGCIVVMTSCDSDGASSSDEFSVTLKLESLNLGESWNLLCKKVFPEANHMQELLVGEDFFDNAARFTDSRNNLVKECGGFPLAIITLGGHLIGKDWNSNAWRGEFPNLKQTNDHCERILDLSYTDLPYYLKSCFLYLFLFPNDYEINVEKLMLLWVAEGFVMSRDGKKMEDVAKDCLDELIQRSLIQVDKSKYNEGPVKSCRIRNSLWEIHPDREKLLAERRHAVYPNSQVAGEIETRKLRSLLFFNERFKVADWMLHFREGTKMLRVLDLEGVNLESIFPRAIGNLALLRYLGLRNTKAKVFPISICNMVYLQTLDVRGFGLEDARKITSKHKVRNLVKSHDRESGKARTDMKVTLPENIWKMKQLRHLYLGTSTWSGLKRARRIVVDDLPKDLLTLDVSGIIWLKLGGIGLSRSFYDFDCLRSLTLHGELEFDRLQYWYFPRSLNELSLQCSGLKDDPSIVLGNLENLRILLIGMGAYKGNEMHFHKDTFKELQFLQIVQLDNFKTWIVEEGTLAGLKHLEINNCEKLEMLPGGLQNVKTIKKIDMLSMPEEFLTRASPGGDDWHKIKHIPLITLTSRE